MKEAGVELPALNESAGTRILVARDLEFIGSIRFADQVRHEAADAIRYLQRMGLQIELTPRAGNPLARMN
jgi:cation transport ATPase